MKPEEFFQAELERLRLEFLHGDYLAFAEALVLCTDNRFPLPDWAAAQAISNAEAVWEMSTGRGCHGNWQAAHTALQRDRHRARLADMHLQARHREGRYSVSWLAEVCDYGKPHPRLPGVRIATRADVFQFVSQFLRGTPAQGSPGAIEDSYEKVRKTEHPPK